MMMMMTIISLHVVGLLRQYIGTPPYGHLVFYGHFFLSQQNGHTISYKKPSLKRSPVNTANGHILKSQTVITLYDFTPLMATQATFRKPKLL